jgi:hypothetical protein
MYQINKLKIEYNELLANSFSNIEDTSRIDINSNSELDTRHNVFVFSKAYEEPYDLQTFNLHHLLFIKDLLANNYKFTFFNRRFDIYIPYEIHCIRNTDSILSEFNSANFIWTFENDEEIGDLYENLSEYNDEGGYDITKTYESTCIIYWK